MHMHRPPWTPPETIEHRPAGWFRFRQGNWEPIEDFEKARLKKVGDTFYRKRRGQWVAIPDEWVGKQVYPLTKERRSRESREFRGSGRRAHRHLRMSPAVLDKPSLP